MGLGFIYIWKQTENESKTTPVGATRAYNGAHLAVDTEKIRSCTQD